MPALTPKAVRGECGAYTAAGPAPAYVGFGSGPITRPQDRGRMCWIEAEYGRVCRA